MTLLENLFFRGGLSSYRLQAVYKKYIKRSNDGFGLKLGTMLAQLGHDACPTWVTCLPIMGNVLALHGQRACPCWADLLSDKCPKVNVVIPIFLFSGFSRLLQFLSAEFLTSDKSFHLAITTFISKPSRQLADNHQTVNHLVIRILQPKTRQSDGFLHFWGNMTFEVNWGEISTNY